MIVEPCGRSRCSNDARNSSNQAVTPAIVRVISSDSTGALGEITHAFDQQVELADDPPPPTIPT
jgi:glycine cleavage system regulatory protein